MHEQVLWVCKSMYELVCMNIYEQACMNMHRYMLSDDSYLVAVPSVR